MRLEAVLLAAALSCAVVAGAAGADAPAARPFEIIPIEPHRPAAHSWAYVAMGTGIALIGASFVFNERADDAYSDYLTATDPDRIDALYDRAVRYDWLERGSLIGGETLIATALYLRFIRQPQDSKLSLAWEPRRCALVFRF
jgi:hypothetical protein